jgi:hypothetical protein
VLPIANKFQILSAKMWLCVAIAMLAASVASVLVESASNAGLFGSGNFTDHSYGDIPPVLLTAVVLIASYAWIRIRLALSESSNRAEQIFRWLNGVVGADPLRIVPVIFLAQLTILYLMETAEQFVIYGHALGGNVWLGGPAVISVGAQAVICVIIVRFVVLALRALAEATEHVVRLVRALAATRSRGAQFLNVCCRPANNRYFARVLRSTSQRAPPILTA